jgi:FKBP-type peptidyl-prolyl cis-trans isomerase SlpA
MTKKEITLTCLVQMHFSIANENGTNFISTFNEDPFVFEMNQGTFPNKIELALLGLQEDNKQEIKLSPSQAFGEHDPKLHKILKRSSFGKENLVIGEMRVFSTEQGELTGAITELTDEEVKIDLNHPLAGQSILLKTHILLINEKS